MPGASTNNRPNRSRQHTLAFSGHELVLVSAALRLAAAVAKGADLPMVAARRLQLATRFAEASRAADDTARGHQHPAPRTEEAQP